MNSESFPFLLLRYQLSTSTAAVFRPIFDQSIYLPVLFSERIEKQCAKESQKNKSKNVFFRLVFAEESPTRARRRFDRRLHSVHEIEKYLSPGVRSLPSDSGTEDLISRMRNAFDQHQRALAASAELYWIDGNVFLNY